MKTLLSSLLVFLSVVGCASIPPAPSDEDLQSADYGPAPGDVEPTIKSELLQMLKDPESLKDFKVFPAEKSWVRIDRDWPQFVTGKPVREFIYCWKVAYHYNAKNSYGGYVGREFRHYYYKDGKRIGQGIPSEFGDIATLYSD